MFELTYDILDDLEAIECNGASQICSNSVTNIFENMTPAEWYDAASESGCNVMFTCGFFLDKCQNEIYIIGDFLNDIVYRFFGETLKVQPVVTHGIQVHRTLPCHLSSSQVRMNARICPLPAARKNFLPYGIHTGHSPR